MGDLRQSVPQNGRVHLHIVDKMKESVLRHVNPLLVRYFQNPCDCDPPTEISKTLTSSKIPLKYLTFTFGERTFTFRERAFTFGERTFTFGDYRGFRVFWNFFFCCWGVLGLRGWGGPVGLSKISKLLGWYQWSFCFLGFLRCLLLSLSPPRFYKMTIRSSPCSRQLEKDWPNHDHNYLRVHFAEPHFFQFWGAPGCCIKGPFYTLEHRENKKIPHLKSHQVPFWCGIRCKTFWKTLVVVLFGPSLT